MKRSIILIKGRGRPLNFSRSLGLRRRDLMFLSVSLGSEPFSVCARLGLFIQRPCLTFDFFLATFEELLIKVLVKS